MLYRRSFTQFLDCWVMGKNRVVIYHQKSIFTDLSTDTSIWPFFTFIEGYKVGRITQSFRSVLETSIWECPSWPGRAAPACFWVGGSWRGPRKRACCLLLGRLTGDKCLRSTEMTADFPMSKPRHRHLQLLHSALPAHKGKKRQSPQPLCRVCECVCVSPSDHRMEEVN